MNGYIKTITNLTTVSNGARRQQTVIDTYEIQANVEIEAMCIINDSSIAVASGCKVYVLKVDPGCEKSKRSPEMRIVHNIYLIQGVISSLVSCGNKIWCSFYDSYILIGLEMACMSLSTFTLIWDKSYSRLSLTLTGRKLSSVSQSQDESKFEEKSPSQTNDSVFEEPSPPIPTRDRRKALKRRSQAPPQIVNSSTFCDSSEPPPIPRKSSHQEFRCTPTSLLVYSDVLYIGTDYGLVGLLPIQKELRENVPYICDSIQHQSKPEPVTRSRAESNFSLCSNHLATPGGSVSSTDSLHNSPTLIGAPVTDLLAANSFVVSLVLKQNSSESFRERSNTHLSAGHRRSRFRSSLSSMRSQFSRSCSDTDTSVSDLAVWIGASDSRLVDIRSYIDKMT